MKVLTCWRLRHQVSTTRQLPLGDDCPPAGFAYLLEAELVQQVIAVWSRWRDGAQPTGLQKCEAVLYFATYDAYLPRDID